MSVQRKLSEPYLPQAVRYFSFLSWLIFTSNFLLPSPQTLQSINQFCEEILFYVRVKLLKTLTSIFGQTTAFFSFNFLKTPDKYLNDISEKWTYFLLLLKLATKQKAAQIHVCSINTFWSCLQIRQNSH